MSNNLSLSTLGEALGLSKGQVSKLAARGMPVDSVEAARAWRAKSLHPSWVPAARGDEAGADGAGPADFWASKARKEAAQAELAELDLWTRRGRLVEVEDVHRALFTAHRMLRDQILSVPGRLAARVVGLAPPAAAELMRTELRACLESFAQLNDAALDRIAEEGRK